MSRYIVDVNTEEENLSIAVGYDYQSKRVYWMVTNSEGILDSNVSGNSLQDYLASEHNIALESIMQALPGIAKMLEEDEVYGDLRKEMSDTEIAGIGLAVVDPNRVIEFGPLTVPQMSRPRG